MKLELTEKDVFLLKQAVSVLILFLAVRFLVMPQLSRRQELGIRLEELAETRQEMEDSIASVPSLKSSATARLEELLAVSKPYYDAMENRQVDELLTGLALEMDLFPVSLSIEDTRPELPEAYLYSTLPEAGEPPSGTYVLTARARLILLGTQENVFRFLDAVETRCPAVQIRSMQLAKRTYLDEDWGASEQTEASFTLAVYMCDRSSL